MNTVETREWKAAAGVVFGSGVAKEIGRQCPGWNRALLAGPALRADSLEAHVVAPMAVEGADAIPPLWVPKGVEKAGNGSVTLDVSGRVAGVECPTAEVDEVPMLPVLTGFAAAFTEGGLDAIRWVAKACSTDETRPRLLGLRLEAAAGAVTAIATDGGRLHVATVETVDPAQGGVWAFVLPPVAIAMLGMGRSAVRLCVEAKHWSLEGQFGKGNGTYAQAWGRLDTEPFPNWQQVVPTESLREYGVNRKAAATAAARVLAADKAAGLGVGISAEYILGEHVMRAVMRDGSEEQIGLAQACYQDAYSIRFNPRYMAELVDTPYGPVPTLSFTDQYSPVLMRAGGLMGILMPMRTK